MIYLNAALLFGAIAFTPLLDSLNAQEVVAYGNALDFDAAYQQVLEQSFELKAANSSISAYEAGYYQAGRSINPELTFGADHLGRNKGDDNNEFFVGVAQVFELGGKRSARKRVAEADHYTAKWQFEIVKSHLFIDFLHAYIDLAVEQERLALAESQQAVSNNTVACLTEKATIGKLSPFELKKAEFTCRTSQLKLAKRQAQFVQARNQLLSFWDCAAPTFDRVSYPLFDTPLPCPLSNLYQALQSNPLIAKSLGEIAKTCEVARLERTRRIPNVAVAVGVSTEEVYRRPALFVGVEVPLTIFDNNQGNIARASYENEQAVYNQLNISKHLEAKLKIEYAGWTIAYEQAATLKNEIIPHAEEAYRLAELSYREGKFDYLNLLNAQTALFDVKEQYLEAVAEYHHRRADVLKLTTTDCFENTIGGMPCENF